MKSRQCMIVVGFSQLSLASGFFVAILNRSKVCQVIP